MLNCWATTGGRPQSFRVRLSTFNVLLLLSSTKLILELLNQRLNVYSVLLLTNSERLVVEFLSQRLNVHSILLLISSERLLVELLSQRLNIHSILQREASRRAPESEYELAQHLADGRQRDANRRDSESETQRQHRLSDNQERIATYRENLLLKKGSKEGNTIASLQPGEGVQLGNLLMTDRGQLLKNLDRVFTLAQLIPAIVVPVCVMTMAGLLLMQTTLSSSLYMTGS